MSHNNQPLIPVAPTKETRDSNLGLVRMITLVAIALLDCNLTFLLLCFE